MAGNCVLLTKTSPQIHPMFMTAFRSAATLAARPCRRRRRASSRDKQAKERTNDQLKNSMISSLGVAVLIGSAAFTAPNAASLFQPQRALRK